jgi:glycosyltransferase involved in cell wall biosynthesis
MVLTRAFACATPVVASDIPGYRGVMEPSVGVLVQPGDPLAVTTAVEKLLADEPRREQLGRAARELAVSKYSWDDIAGRLTEIYEGLAARVKVAA